MSGDRKSVPVSLPAELVSELDELVEVGAFSSRSEALRYGARLVVREQRLVRLHDVTSDRAREDIEERLDRKRVSWPVYLDTDVALADLKSDDWLSSAVDLDTIDDPCTSVATTIEVQYVLEDEWPRDRLVDVHDVLRDAGVTLLDLTPEAVDSGAELRRRYPQLNLFDAVHLGTARTADRQIVSTDTLYPEIEEVDHVDPRDL